MLNHSNYPVIPGPVSSTGTRHPAKRFYPSCLPPEREKVMPAFAGMMLIRNLRWFIQSFTNFEIDSKYLFQYRLFRVMLVTKITSFGLGINHK